MWPCGNAFRTFCVYSAAPIAPAPGVLLPIVAHTLCIARTQYWKKNSWKMYCNPTLFFLLPFGYAMHPICVHTDGGQQHVIFRNCTEAAPASVRWTRTRARGSLSFLIRISCFFAPSLDLVLTIDNGAAFATCRFHNLSCRRHTSIRFLRGRRWRYVQLFF